jgi:hypothetical protein
VNGVWFFLDTDHHHSAFSSASTDKTDSRVLFEWMKVRDSVHVYVEHITIGAGKSLPLCHMKLCPPLNIPHGPPLNIPHNRFKNLIMAFAVRCHWLRAAECPLSGVADIARIGQNVRF